MLGCPLGGVSGYFGGAVDMLVQRVIEFLQAQNVRTVAQHPWLLIPALFVVFTVLCFNFVGDGLRDAAGPYK